MKLKVINYPYGEQVMLPEREKEMRSRRFEDLFDFYITMFIVAAVSIFLFSFAVEFFDGGFSVEAIKAAMP